MSDLATLEASLTASMTGSAQAACVVDNLTRQIEIPDGLEIAGVESDDCTHVLKICVPRFTDDGSDLNSFNVYINFINGNNEKAAYVVNHNNIVAGTDTLTLSWALSRLVLAKSGIVRFSVCFKLLSTTNEVLKEWNSAIAELTVLDGIEADEVDYTIEYPKLTNAVANAEGYALLAKQYADAAQRYAAQAGGSSSSSGSTTSEGSDYCALEELTRRTVSYTASSTEAITIEVGKDCSALAKITVITSNTNTHVKLTAVSGATFDFWPGATYTDDDNEYDMVSSQFISANNYYQCTIDMAAILRQANGTVIKKVVIEPSIGDRYTISDRMYERALSEYLKTLGTGSGTTVVQNPYTLPVATSTTLGGVKPVGKTSAMTQVVGVDSEGKLYTEPSTSSDSPSLSTTNKLYVDDFKTASNTWVDAFIACMTTCANNGKTACTVSKDYTVTGTITINCNVDFSNSKITLSSGLTNDDACIKVAGGSYLTIKLGEVVNSYGIAVHVMPTDTKLTCSRIEIDSARGAYGGLVVGGNGMKAINFNSFYIRNIASRKTGSCLKLVQVEKTTGMLVENTFDLYQLNGMSSQNPKHLIEMQGTSRNIFRGADLENACDTGVAVVVEDCGSITFDSFRLAESENETQFKFVGMCASVVYRGTIAKIETIDYSELSDFERVHVQFNADRVIDKNSIPNVSEGRITNIESFRVHSKGIVPILNSNDTYTANSNYSLSCHDMQFMDGRTYIVGVPKKIKWSGGNITIDEFMLFRMRDKVRIIKTSDNVGNLLYSDGTVFKNGSELSSNTIYEFGVESVTSTVINTSADTVYSNSERVTGVNLELIPIGITDVDALVNARLAGVENGSY